MVALCQMNRIVIQSSVKPVYLNDSLRCKLTAKELYFIITEPFVRGREVLRSHFMQYEFIQVWVGETALVLKKINSVKHIHTCANAICCRGWGYEQQDALWALALKM